MHLSRRIGFSMLIRGLLLTVAAAVSGIAAPVIDPPPSLDPENPGESPKIPVGKALVVPLSISNAGGQPFTYADGGPLSLKVTSSNARIPVRIKTGNPVLRIHVSYAGTAEVPAFEGDLYFQLFRDFAPITSKFIAGFAQAGYYDNLLFHRIATELDGTPFVVQGGDPAGTGNGYEEGTEETGPFLGLPFEFENEFHPGLIFAGRGQLAMANRGYNRGTQFLDQPLIELGDFRATNGSQFFITFRQPRFLDFKHTIFGQLIRGFDILDKIEAVPVDEDEKPTAELKMTSVTVLPGTGEATLFIGANGAGDAKITVTATDANGAAARREILVRTVDDTVNTRPFMLPLGTRFSSVGSKPQLSVSAMDLEFDYMVYGIAAAGNATSPFNLGNANMTGDYTPRETAGRQSLALGVAGFNDGSRFASPTAANAFAPFDAYNFQVLDLVFGDQIARPEAIDVRGAPAVELTSVPVGRIYDLDAAGSPSHFTAQINWGDGTAPVAGVVSREGSAPGGATYVVRGTHTYARPGIYPVVVKANGNLGTPVIIRSTAVINAADLVATGTEIQVIGPKLGNRILATFTDANSTNRAADYEATVEWGDGQTSKGTIAKAPNGSFLVRGTHVYKDSQTYSISVRVHKKDADPSTDTLAWTTAGAAFSSTRYLPPFPQAHIVAAWGGNIPSKFIRNSVTTTFNPADLEVELSGNFEVLNSGNRGAQGKVRYWLSDDAELDLTGEDADTALKVNKVKELVVSIPPGASGSGNFTIALPKGESGGGKYLLSQLVYSDPIADHSAVDKVVVSGPIRPTIAIFNRLPAATNGTRTSEDGTSVTFDVALDTAPTANVTFPLESNTVTEGTVSPAQLVFTSQNWSQPQTVTVTGVNDDANDGDKTFKVTLKTPTTDDLVYKGLAARELTFTNMDNDE